MEQTDKCGSFQTLSRVGVYLWIPYPRFHLSTDLVLGFPVLLCIHPSIKKKQPLKKNMPYKALAGLGKPSVPTIMLSLPLNEKYKKQTDWVHLGFQMGIFLCAMKMPGIETGACCRVQPGPQLYTMTSLLGRMPTVDQLEVLPIEDKGCGVVGLTIQWRRVRRERWER